MFLVLLLLNRSIAARPFERIQDSLYLPEILTFIIFRSIYETVQNDDILAVTAVERMRDERASHIIAVDLPQSPGLRKLSPAETDELHLRSSYLIGNHIGIVEHSRNILLQELIPVGNDVLLGKVFLVRSRILIYEDALRRILLVIGYPDEIIRLLPDSVPHRKIRRTARHLLHYRSDVRRLIPLGIDNDAVTLGLLDGIDDPLAVFLEKSGGRVAGRRGNLDHALRIGPDVMPVDNPALAHILRYIIYDNVPVNLEQVGESRRRDIDDGKQRFPLRQEG